MDREVYVDQNGDDVRYGEYQAASPADGMAEAIAIERGLLAAGVHLGEHDRRLEMARGLVAQGLTSADLGMLREHFDRLAPDDPYRAAALLNWRLQSPNLWRPLLRELHVFKAFQERRRHAEGGGTENGTARPYEASVSRGEYARYLHAFEQVSKDNLCEQLGVTADELEQLLDGEIS